MAKPLVLAPEPKTTETTRDKPAVQQSDLSTCSIERSKGPWVLTKQREKGYDKILEDGVQMKSKRSYAPVGSEQSRL